MVLRTVHNLFGPIVVPKVLYICVSCKLLAHKSRDLSQAEKKLFLKAEKIHKMTILTEKSLFVQFETTFILVTSWNKSRNSWANNQKLTEM